MTIIRPRRPRRAGWPSVFQAMCVLAQSSKLPAPVSVVRTGPGTAVVALDGNADAVAWMRQVDPGAAFVCDRYGVLHVRCDWMGWSITISGAGDPPEPPPAVRARPRRPEFAYVPLTTDAPLTTNLWTQAA